MYERRLLVPPYRSLFLFAIAAALVRCAGDACASADRRVASGRGAPSGPGARRIGGRGPATPSQWTRVLPSVRRSPCCARGDRDPDDRDSRSIRRRRSSSSWWAATATGPGSGVFDAFRARSRRRPATKSFVFGHDLGSYDTFVRHRRERGSAARQHPLRIRQLRRRAHRDALAWAASSRIERSRADSP